MQASSQPSLVMFSTTVTDTGEITLPAEIRKHLNLVSGSRVEFVIDADGQVKIFPLNVPVETLSGILYRPDIRPATLDDMEAAISKGANDRT
ncbi:AbrB/MazE/SpoVT family DNA-binding domain-containing protein [Nostoc sp. FACHB-110]|uniref:AbrB/MazE/SpoVT family DNA-binding domain-containing protein n=1 Tax=Nostoc sp. FACHB-110 TaxID=2692834 RepID=UPI001F556180|nr:AbrB/MazE/SpoVT family DNA-binding domain-containing protein [Nostoc sp. FACHB-110]